MAEETAAFYDAVYRSSVAYRRGHRSAPWAPLWAFAANAVKPGDRVLDIGCGPGHFAAELRERGQLAEIAYLGVDFSRVALQQAARRVPGADFRYGVLPRGLPALLAKWKPTVVVACEVLEHVEADLLIVGLLPPGRRFVATLPRNMCRGHVRAFNTGGAVRARYQRLLDIEKIRRVKRNHWGLLATRAASPAPRRKSQTRRSRG